MKTEEEIREQIEDLEFIANTPQIIKARRDEAAIQIMALKWVLGNHSDNSSCCNEKT